MSARALKNVPNIKSVIGTWSPVLKIFQMGLKKGPFNIDSALPGGDNTEIAKVR